MSRRRLFKRAVAIPDHTQDEIEPSFCCRPYCRIRSERVGLKSVPSTSVHSANHPSAQLCSPRPFCHPKILQRRFFSRTQSHLSTRSQLAQQTTANPRTAKVLISQVRRFVGALMHKLQGIGSRSPRAGFPRRTGQHLSGEFDNVGEIWLKTSAM